MKKYLQAIITSLLITLLLPVLGNFCVSDLFAHSFFDTDINETSFLSMSAPTDDCQEMEINNFKKLASNNYATTDSNHSILPCCSHDNLVKVTVNLQSIKLSKISAILSFNQEILENVTFADQIYYIPEILPPELLSLKTTVLRL